MLPKIKCEVLKMRNTRRIKRMAQKERTADYRNKINTIINQPNEVKNHNE